MQIKDELLIEGNYEYFNNQSLYAQEKFKLLRMHESKHLKMLTEFFSRLENGELLKVTTEMHLNQQYYPIFQRIEKSMGKRYSHETFGIDTTDQKLSYVFQNNSTSQEYTQNLSSKHYLVNSSFACSCFFTLSRSFDATGRTTLYFMSSQNEWEYSSPPVEQVLYGEYKVRSLEDYKLNGHELNATHLCLFENDKDHTGATDIFISKHYAIPYEMKADDLHIKIKHLKKFETDE